MAQMGVFKALAVLLVVAMFLAIVSAQGPEMAPAPSPVLDKGAAAYSFGISLVLICSSLFLSLLALLKQ